MKHLVLMALLVAVPAAALPQDPNERVTPPKRVRNVLLFGDEQCPKPASDEEIVVCAPAGESPYRIPKRFREAAGDSPANTSWVRRAELIEDANKVGMPGSCSPVGTYGQSGCTRAVLDAWRAEREAKLREEAAAEPR